MLCEPPPADVVPVAKAEQQSISPTENGIGSLYKECDGDSEKSNDSDAEDMELPPRVGQPLPQLELCSDDSHDTFTRSISNNHLEEQGHEEEKAQAESEAQYAPQCEEEQASSPGEEDDGPPRMPSRFDGHPLGTAFLEEQEGLVEQEYTAALEQWVMQAQQRKRWSLEHSQVRAKILVSEAYFLEKKQLEGQEEWLESDEHAGPPPPAAFAFGQGMLLPRRLHREMVREKLRTVESRWSTVGRQVCGDMAFADNFPFVIRNLSSMRIFVQGHQSMYYGLDPCEQMRRMQAQQAVLDRIRAQNDGTLFVKPCPPPPRHDGGDGGGCRAADAGQGA